MPFFSPWIKAVFIIFLTFPCHSETSFNQEAAPVRQPPKCGSFSNFMCTKEFDPICASDGHTYGNGCIFCSIKREIKDKFWFLRYGTC